MIEQRPVPPGAPQVQGGALTEVYVGWIDWITKAVNWYLQGRFYRTVKVTGNYAMREIDSAVLADATAGNIAIQLLDSRKSEDKRVTVKKIDASANTVTLLGTIDGAANLAIGTQYQSYDLVPNTDINAWWVV